MRILHNGCRRLFNLLIPHYFFQWCLIFLPPLLALFGAPDSIVYLLFDSLLALFSFPLCNLVSFLKELQELFLLEQELLLPRPLLKRSVFLCLSFFGDLSLELLSLTHHSSSDFTKILCLVQLLMCCPVLHDPHSKSKVTN